VIALTPAPIGVAPAYHPPALVRSGAPVGRLTCTTGGARYGVHVELFARGLVVVVPAGIGVTRVAARRFGTIVPAGCSYPARTLTPTGIVEVKRGARLTLGDLFRVWGQPLGLHRLVSFRSAAPLLAFVGGRPWRGDPRAIPLARHAEIVLELGGYVPPHVRFLFPGGL
jgi:hypothetical protein